MGCGPQHAKVVSPHSSATAKLGSKIEGSQTIEHSGEGEVSRTQVQNREPRRMACFLGVNLITHIYQRLCEELNPNEPDDDPTCRRFRRGFHANWVTPAQGRTNCPCQPSKDREVSDESLIGGRWEVACGQLPQKGCAVAGNAPDTLFVLLRDEEAAGRIVVELGSFVRFSRKMDRQLARLQKRTLKRYPQLMQRGAFGRPPQSA